MKNLFLSVMLLFAASIYAQTATTSANIALPSPTGSNFSWLGSGKDTAGITHLLILARTPDQSKAGHFISSNGGNTWSGSDTIPNDSDGNDPYGAIDVNSGYAYDSYTFGHVARSSDWGNTWNQNQYYGSWGDAPSIAVDEGKHSKYEGRVYVCGTANFGYSKDSGKTFTVIPEHTIMGGVDIDQPRVIVDGNSIVYVIGISAGAFQVGYSTNGGVAWNQYSISWINATETLPIDCYDEHDHPTTHLIISAAAHGNLLCIMFEDGYGMELAWTTTRDTTTWNDSHISNYIQPTVHGGMPSLVLDSVGNIYCGFYAYKGINNNGDTLRAYSLLISPDTGNTWTSVQVADTSSAMTYFDDCNSGGWEGACLIDSDHLGCAWSDNRYGSYNLYFASVPIGTQFVNKFGTQNDSLGATKLLCYQSNNPIDTDTVTSFNSITSLLNYTLYIAQSDTLRHIWYNGSSYTSFGQFTWNGSTQFSDEIFAHSFPGSGIVPQRMTSNFVPLDSLTGKMRPRRRKWRGSALVNKPCASQRFNAIAVYN